MMWVKRMLRLERRGKRSEGRPKRNFIDVVKENEKVVGVRGEHTEERVRWSQKAKQVKGYLGKILT